LIAKTIKGGINKSAFASSSSAWQVPKQQTAATAASRVKDNDGDYDNGTVRDDAATARELQLPRNLI
jgi:hypothetical protein